MNQLELIESVKLPFRFLRAFRAKMEVEHKLFLTEEQVNDIWLFFDCVKDVECRVDPDLEQMIFVVEGKTYRFDKYNSNLIDTLRKLPSELRIRAMSITTAEMEKLLQAERDNIVNDLKKMFANNRYKWRETGEPMDWKELFEICYTNFGFEQKITTSKIIADIQKGKLTIDFAIEMREQLLDTVYL